MNTTLRIASILPESRVNGPGVRSVVHFQGCTLGCPGCFNPHTHPGTGGRIIEVEALAEQLANSAVDGVTISGGEPFEQAEGLHALVVALRRRHVPSILIFTGYEFSELERLPRAEQVLDEIDVLVAGRYDATDPASGSILASANQRAHFLSEVHTPEELELGGNLEITIRPDGTVHLTGFPPPDVRRLVRRLGD